MVLCVINTTQIFLQILSVSSTKENKENFEVSIITYYSNILAYRIIRDYEYLYYLCRSGGKQFLKYLSIRKKKKNYTSAYVYYLLRHFCTIANTVKFPQRSRNSTQRDTIMNTILKKLRLLKKTKYLFTFIGYIYTALEFCRYLCII